MNSAPAPWLQRNTSIVPLVVLRVVFGLTMFAGTLRFVAMGWVETLYLQPSFHFTYLGFGWVKPLPGVWLYVVYGAMALCALGIAAGAFYRVSIVGFFLLFSYTELLDKSYYLNHYYFVSLLSLLLIFLPLHHWAAVDAWRRPESASPVVAQWTMAAVRLQLALVYLFAGVAKLQADWLFRAMPLKIWLSAHAGFPLIGGLFDHAAMAYAMSWGGLFYDLTIPFLLLYPRTRRLGFVAVIGFHVMTRLLFPIGMFPAIMVGCTLVFFPAEDFARVGRWFKLPALRQTTTLSPGRAQLHPVMAGSLALFFAIQIVLPLRHWLYPGNLLWTEEGFRYAWHVMVAEKTGHVTFYVDDPVRGIEFPVFVTDYLTDAQARQMAYQPDMILEFAHYLQTDLRNQGIPDAAVRAEAYVSLNGRPSQLLIDPTVDLTKETNSIWPKPWILPLADDPPRHQLASFN